MKSPNMISRIGRWPRKAIPAATPKSDASLIGVVRTRSGYASLRPCVTLNAPPYGVEHVLAEEDDVVTRGEDGVQRLVQHLDAPLRR